VRQELAVPELARAVHAQWRSARERDGWRFGPPDVAAKTSPYLKPIEAFDELEWRRERWLALTDLLAIAAHAPARLTAIEIPTTMVSRLQCERTAWDIEAIAGRAHSAWAAINQALGIADLRARLPFHDLNEDAKRRSRANVACDIAAIAALTQSYACARLRVHACTDMIADKHMCSMVLGALGSVDPPR
jgi:hypothetical protein